MSMKAIRLAALALACLLLAGCGDGIEVSEPSSSSLDECSDFSAESDDAPEDESSTANDDVNTPSEQSADDSDPSDEPSLPTDESADDASLEESTDDASLEESADDTSSTTSSTVVEVSKPETSTATEYAEVDFAKLQKINKDIYAWIRIPGTVIDYPILNRPGDNARYLDHNYYGYADKNGSIFTEDYNSRDFNDRVTLIYGHNMSSGAMFGSIQKTYTKKSFMDAHKELLIILPDKTYTYEIFAAVPYSSIHLMASYNFSSAFIFQEVMNDILSVRALNAVVDRTVKVTSSDHIVILSTCLSGDGSKRYLLLAVRRDGE